ncbi:MAG: LacI family DNA-binding transcriptional regulator [Gammaproteobacteria bacterium]|nr:LacI family DNA-binding transcriptional regulator [Gammaproteobacteria bacterium]
MKPTRLKKTKETKRDQPTLKEVAAAAKVSEMTVSRVLRETGSVSKKTKAKVLAVVDDMGFVPNKVAGSLATSSSNLIAVIVPSLRNQVFTEVLSGVTDYLDTTGYKAVIGISDYKREKEEQLVRSMLSWRPSGLIVSNLTHSDRTRKIMANANIPVVEMMETTEDPVDFCVGLDHIKAGALMARHFIDQGYRRIGYVGCNDRDRTAAKRFKGFAAALRKDGLKVEGTLEYDQPVSMELGKKGIAALLSDYPHLDAVYFPNDIAAIGGLFHCLEAGISIPSSVAIGGFSGLKIGQLMPVPLTTVRVGRFEVGQRSARIIVDRLNGKHPNHVNIVDIKLIKGGTT